MNSIKNRLASIEAARQRLCAIAAAADTAQSSTVRGTVDMPKDGGMPSVSAMFNAIHDETVRQLQEVAKRVCAMQVAAAQPGETAGPLQPNPETQARNDVIDVEAKPVSDTNT